MNWWQWLLLVVVIVLALVGVFAAIQASRRKGGVIVDPASSPRTKGGGRS